MRNTTVILFLFSLHVVAAADDEGTALLDFKLSFQDVDNALSNWVDTLNYCNWRGVTCNNVTFHVFALNLSGFNLGGQISPSIGYLKGLTDIDLSENHISGQIPYQIGDCLALNFLVLTDNLLTGPIPSTLSQIPNLQVLDLSYNMLSGDIPSLIYWNEGLQYLGLRENNLTGSLSPDMCHLPGLWYFDVRNNSLTGNIPLNIGNCTFRLLDLSYNQLTGEIPFNIGFLRVVTLLLQGNRFTGKIPSAIGRMQALSLLDLSCNFLTGPIPPILGNLTNAEKLFLHGNKLTGSIPPELGNMTMLHYLKLYDNRLSGHIPPELGKLTDLYELNVANNYLQGPIPENLSSCTNLNNLNLYNNKLNGTIPPAFQKLESMTHLNLSSNNIKGPIPIELSRIVNLDTLDLSNNQISGSIPSFVGELEHLLKLNLSKNRMTGYIPAEFGNLQSVMEIDLSYNQLSGQIPQGLVLLQNLLSLSFNSLNLQDYVHLQSVMEIDFSCNQLSGQIPQGLGLLQNLLSLRVENNNLTGDLLSLVDSLSLSDLNVSYNNLAGNIPSGHKLSRFPPNSFIGNPGLCGSSINSACHNSHSTKRAPISIAAILGIAFGSLVILLMILVAVCRRQNQPPFSEGTMDKPVHHISPKLVIFHKNMALHEYEDVMRMTENWSEKYIIGFGACSTVYKCILNNCRPVAIKRLHSQNPQSLEFETELETVGSIKHRNLVCLQGYSLSPSGNLLFYDYMENGSLWDLLHDPEKKQKLDWDTRLKIALGAAQGLAYLHHDCSPYIVHRDVKSSNILVDKDFEAHLTDFGIAKRLCTSNTSTYVMGTIGYIDPEYAQTSRLTVKSDVYSYGIVLLELLTGRQAVDDECNLHDLIMSKTTNNAVSNAVMETVDPDIFATCKDLRAVRRIFQLALLCNKRKASGRPTMHEVTRVLESLVPTVASRQGTPLESLVPTTEASYMDVYLSFNVNRT